MLSISEAIKGVNDAVNYYTKEGKEAYYLAGIGQEGRWLGGAVEPLKLPDTVTAEAFRNLLNGYSPDGRQPLVQNAGHPDRDAGWDLTFSVPKAVSVLWAMSPPSVRAEIEAAQRHAVKTALAQAEEIFGFTRRGQGGKRHEHAALLFAAFEEYTSRAQDMQIHTHCVLINASVRQDGTTGALHSINFFRAKLLLGAVHETELARQLQQRLHVGIEPQTVGFGLAGIPKSVCQHFSKRHTAIQQAMAEQQLSGPVAAKVVTRETRPRKEHVPAGRLFQSWHEQGRSQGWGPEQAAKLVQVQHAVVAKPLEPALRTKLAGLPHEQQTRKGLIKLARVTGRNGGEVYQIQPSAGLRERLDVVAQPDRIGFQLAGVPATREDQAARLPLHPQSRQRRRLPRARGKTNSLAEERRLQYRGPRYDESSRTRNTNG